MALIHSDNVLVTTTNVAVKFECCQCCGTAHEPSNKRILFSCDCQNCKTDTTKLKKVRSQTTITANHENKPDIVHDCTHRSGLYDSVHVEM